MSGSLGVGIAATAAPKRLHLDGILLADRTPEPVSPGEDVSADRSFGVRANRRRLPTLTARSALPLS